MVTFKLAPHSELPNTQIVEIYVDSKLVGAVYPQEPDSIRVISNHLVGVQGGGVGYPTVYQFKFSYRH